MALALALMVDQQTVEEDQVKISMPVLFYDPILGIREERQVSIKFLPSATVQQIENFMEAAILDQAHSFWPTMVIGVSDIIMLDIKKGN